MPYRLSLTFVTLLLVSVGCGGLSPSDRRASLTVANLSDFTICSVYATPHRRTPEDRGPHPSVSLDETDWGTDLLEREERVAPGESHTLPIQAGRYDVRLDDCRGRALWARRGMRITGARNVEFRPIRVERPSVFDRRRVADGPATPSAM